METRSTACAPTAAAGGADKEKTVFLVSCVGKKAEGPLPAKDLYASAWFKKARHFAESSGCRWFILSAEYGLVKPDQQIESYNNTLNTMLITDRKEWADNVITQIGREVSDLIRVVFLAGKRYREFLADHFKRQGLSVCVPMAGLGIGEQLSWLMHHTASSLESANHCICPENQSPRPDSATSPLSR